MTSKDYWEEEVLFYGKSTPVAQLLIEGWAKGDVAVMSALDNYVYATGDDFINTSLMLHPQSVIFQKMACLMKGL